ncbi:MAG: iron ABC transporter permease, partial [Candidatus Thermoplasmatota archaeon]|nr:iron ABC transporter permease [Candidatus Thermoplasmatota archaeon]
MQDPGEDSNTGSPLVGRFRLPLAHDTVREIIRKVSPIAVTATLILLALFSLFVGPVRISWSSAWYIFIAQFNQILNSALTGIHHVISQVPAGVSLFSNTGSRYYTMPEYDIIVQIQEPIVLAAVIVGAALAVGGSTVQGIFRNPITEPYIIGISSGAALGATLTIAVPQFSSDFGAFSLQVNAFFFSLLVVYITYFTSYRRGSVPVT